MQNAQVLNNFSTLSGPERDWSVGQLTAPEKYRERLIKRFWSKVDKAPGLGPKGECWEWRGALTEGYGQMGVVLSRLGLTVTSGDKRPMRAHLVAYCFVYGHGDFSPLGNKKHVCHECNNKKCVRDSHLWSGTPAENVHHAQATGLMPKVDHAQRAFEEQLRQKQRDEHAYALRQFIDRNVYLAPDRRSEKILLMRYGYTQSSSATLEEVGAHFGLTRERVRQIQQMAEERIRMYTIEKNVPLPSSDKPGSLDQIRETLINMAAGDSCLMPRGLSVKVSTVAKMLGYLVTTRKVSDAEMRVWMVNKNRANDQAA